MKKKSIDTVVEDIYAKINLLSSGKSLNVSDAQLDKFSKGMREALKTWLTPKKGKKNNLRMSNIGRPSRQLWYDINSDIKDRVFPPATMIKFLFGHILEPLVLFLVELAEHEVTDEQKEVTINGVKGHMDCKIDGEVVDVKSASSFAFRKFKYGTLPEKDSFGYIAQLAGYEQGENTKDGGFLAINKESGELSLFKPQGLDKPNVSQKIQDIKEMLKEEEPPSLCYLPVHEGKYGNLKLPTECKYCIHKFECHKDANNGRGLRTFKYSRGLTYFTKIVREPRVEEVA